MSSIEKVTSIGEIEKSSHAGKISARSANDIAKNYLDILKDLFAEKEITSNEYSELKRNYEYNLQRCAYT